MKSLQVASLYPDEDALSRYERNRYSDLQVLHLSVGYYVGTLYRYPDDSTEPGTRDTEFYGTQKEAELALEKLEAGTFNMDNYRWTP